MSVGSDIGQALLAALGGTASGLGQMYSDRINSQTDIRKKLAELSMASLLEQSDPYYQAKVAALKQEMGIAGAAEGRAAAEFARKQKLQDLMSEGFKQEFAAGPGRWRADRDIKQALMEGASNRNIAAGEKRAGWMDAASSAFAGGRSGLLKTVNLPLMALFGKLTGKSAEDIYGTPLPLQTERDLAKQSEQQAISDFIASSEKPAYIREMEAAGTPENYANIQLGKGEFSREFPGMGIQNRAEMAAEQRLAVERERLAQKREYTGIWSGLQNRKLDLEAQGQQQKMAIEQLKIDASQAKDLSDIQKAIIIQLLNGKITPEQAVKYDPSLMEHIQLILNGLSGQ